MTHLTFTPEPFDSWADFTLIDLAFDTEFDPDAELDFLPHFVRSREDA